MGTGATGETTTETLAETITETMTVASESVSANIVDIPLIICLMVIVGVLAWGVHYTSQRAKESGNISQLVSFWVVPIITLLAVLFGGDDGYRVRIIILAISMGGYMVFYSLFEWFGTWKEQRNNLNNKSSDKDTIKVTLPLKKDHIIDKRFVDDIPANVASIIHVSEEIRILTNNFVQSFSQQTIDTKRDEELRGYFLGICYHLATLFDHSTRVHVRILKGAKYQKFISTYAYQDGSFKPDLQKMKDMSYDNQMIAKSFENQCSLIKSLNPTLHESGSRNKWQNYLMFALPQITHDGKPVFSMGISVTRKINERFYFLNYCAIETIIGRYIESVLEDEKCGLSDFVERFYFSSP